MNLNFSEPADHILVRAGFCSDRSFKTFIRTHKVEICRQNNSENPERENVVSRKILVDNDCVSVCKKEDWEQDIDVDFVDFNEYGYYLLNEIFLALGLDSEFV